ncbi:hypothetical protein HDU98_002253, partial [Podochytrium sp. JEL0797]
VLPPQEQCASPQQLRFELDPQYSNSSTSPIKDGLQHQKRRRQQQAYASRKWRLEQTNKLSSLQTRTSRLASEKAMLEQRAAILESNARSYLQRELELMRRAAFLEEELRDLDRK